MCISKDCLKTVKSCKVIPNTCMFNIILNFSLSLPSHRVSVSCQIKKMEQPIHIGELISGRPLKIKPKKKKPPR